MFNFNKLCFIVFFLFTLTSVYTHTHPHDDDKHTCQNVDIKLTLLMYTSHTHTVDDVNGLMGGGFFGEPTFIWRIEWMIFFNWNSISAQEIMNEQISGNINLRK